MSAAQSLRVVAFTLLVTPAFCGAAVIRVPQDYGTIGEATGVAAPGDTVLVASGTYYEYDILLPSGVCLMGETGYPTDVIIDADSQGRIISIGDSAGAVETVLTGLTLKRALATTGGALMACGVVIARDVAFERNIADRGGAVACDPSAVLELEDCSFVSNNAALDGAAIFAEGLHLTASRCEFISNRTGCTSGSSSRGGAICMLGAGSHCTLEDCALCWNQTMGPSSTWGWGGGIYMGSSDLTVRGCTFWQNIGEHGSSVYAESGVFENALMAFEDPGHARLIEWHGSTPQFTCCNLWEGPPYDPWYGDIADQLGVDGNMSEWPALCGPPTDPPWALHEDSPCAPANSGGCGLIGACGVGCFTASSEPLSWGRIKQLYR